MNPNKILSSLKASHTVVSSRISNISECARDYQKAYVLLGELESLLFNHFTIQNDGFYMWLEQEGKGPLPLIEFLKVDMQELQVEFLDFLDRYSKNVNSIRIRNFPREFHLFSKKILERFSLEEDQIFPLLAVNNK